MNKHYLSKFFLIGMMSAALPSQVDAQIRVLFDVAAPKGMTDQEAASQQVLYISNNASLLDDTEYIARTKDWSVAPVVKDGKVLSVSLKRSPYQDGGWGMPVRAQAVDVQRNLGLEAGSTLYYRFYDPRFIKPIKGSAVIAPDAAGYQKISITQTADYKRVTFNPVIGRDGNVVRAVLAPDMYAGSVGATTRYRVNVVELDEDSYSVFAPVGEKVRYVMMPQDTNCSLHVDSLTMGSEDAVVNTDYRDAVKCSLYIKDTKGNNCPITSGSPKTTYYCQPKGAGSYGYGTYGNQISEASDGTTYVYYALPGRQLFEVGNPQVDTSDPDFLMPYSSWSNWLVSEVTVGRGTRVQDVTLATSNPVTISALLKGAARFEQSACLTFKASYLYPEEDYFVPLQSAPVERKAVGNDLKLSYRINGACNKVQASLSYNFSEASDTISTAIEARWAGNEWNHQNLSLTGRDFSAANPLFDGLDFGKVHPVKFVIPCPYLKENASARVALFNNDLLLATGTHHAGCSKSLLNEAPFIPNDTLTFLLPEGTIDYSVMADEETISRKDNLELASRDDLLIEPFATNYSLLRVSDADGEHLINVTDGSENYKYESSPIVQLEPTGAEGASEQHVYFSYPVTIPLQPGFNDYTRNYREVKLTKAKNLTLWPATRYIGEEVESYYANLSIPDDAVQSSSKERRIHLPQGQGMLLAAYTGGITGVQLFDILPSDNDTLLVFPYGETRKRVEFYYNGESISTKCVGHNGFNLFYEPNHVRIGFLDGARYNPWTMNRMQLYSGKYQVSGILFMADKDSYEEVPFGPVSFEVTDKAVSVELNPEYTGIGAVEANESAATIVARYTIDGRRINHPQSGINLLQMSDGSVRKVVVK
mgnify:FL=1